MRALRWFLGLWLVTWCSLVAAQVTADPALTKRANELPAVLGGTIAYAEYFDPAFTSAVPEAQFRTINTQLTAANGPITGVEAVLPDTPFSGTVKVGYARAIATLQLVVAPTAPHKVTGLRITGAETRDDNREKLSADFAELPGQKALLVTEIGKAPLLAINPDQPGALGSGFKLFVLAEAARAVAAGERRWSDVVPLAPDLVSSASTAGWPAGTPMTLQAAATAMIATSDNRATDTVMAALDPARLGRTATELGIDPRSLPMLTTRQALVLKTAKDGELAKRWESADLAGRRALLRDNAALVETAAIAPAAFTGGPLHIDSVEWFASPTAMSRTLARLRDAGPVVAGILAVNPGGAPKDRFAYVGYKGGSEPGVIAMNHLVRTKTGRWFTVTGYWSNSAKPVEELTYATLTTRALALLPSD
jgi:hypothetical protein